MARTAQRSLELLSLLQTAHRWSGPQLAARLGVSLRTLRRDIDTLRDLGYPIEAGGGRHSTYRLGPGTSLPPLLLDGEQAVAISLALQTSPTAVLGLRDAADRALHTLAQVMPPMLRAQLDATRVTLVRNYWEFPAPPIAPEIVGAVGEAVRQGHVLRADVLRADGTRPAPGDADFAPPRRLEPHHLALWAGRWYVVAYDPAAGGWFVHRVDRLHPQGATGVRFERRELPAGGVAELLMTTPDRGDTPAAWPCVGRATLALPAQVVARFAPGGSVVEPVEPLEPREPGEPLEPGAAGESGAAGAHERCRLVLGAWSWAGIAGILATFDTALADVEPAELRAACAALADRFSHL